LTVIWRPQPGPQERFVQCPVFEVFFGGARGGGKTDAVLGDWIAHQGIHGGYTSGLMVRKQLTELQETIERSRQLFVPLGAKFNEQMKTWRFPNGARLRFAYLERDSDADGYQGHSYTKLYVEEIGTFPSRRPIDKLMATLRNAHGIPCTFRATGNPGGPGHAHVKARYIDPEPSGWKIVPEEFRNPWDGSKVVRERVFIPSKLADNKYLGADYVANLQMVGSLELVRAWLEGDWDIVEGAYFDGWRHNLHVVEPFPIPQDWLRFRSMDWGYASPASIGWWAVVQDDHTVHGKLFPRGALVRYREWYVSSAPGKGLRLTAEEIAKVIKEREKGDGKISYGVADPSMFAEDGGPSHAERMARAGVWFRRADNRRVGTLGQVGGWDQMRSRLRGDGVRPSIYCFDTCKDSIRTIPVLQHDLDNPEDMAEGEDHAADEWRYACMSRPYRTKPTQKKKKGKNIYELTVDELWAIRDRGPGPIRI
jgi:hypothetical protein